MFASAAIILLSILLLGSGFAVSQSIAREAGQVEALALALREEEYEDALQQRIRTGIGDLTRAVERGGTPPRERLEAMQQSVAAFRQHLDESVRGIASLPEGTRHAMLNVRSVGERYADAAQAMIAAATRGKDAVGAEMPRFLDALRALEHHRAAFRSALVERIAADVSANRARGQRDILRVLIGGAGVLVLVAAMATWLRRRLIEPIEAIGARLRHMQAGDQSEPIPGTSRQDELGELARGLAEYNAAVERRRAAEQRADYLAHHDMLTGLANRLMFESRLEQELARSARTGGRVALIAIDLDGFKDVNDRLGHAGGDRAIRRAARLLAGAVRSDELVARLGGDEFAIIQGAATQPAAAEALLARLYAEAQATAEEEVPIRMSIGVAVSEPGVSGDELHRLADTALYRAKAEGRNTARFFDTALREAEALRVRLARDLTSAIDENRLAIAYQPIAEAGSLRIVGYEALVRWDHPTLGRVPPETFLPVAETSGSIRPMGKWVAERAIRAAADWDDGVSLALNLSSSQFREPDFVDELIALAARHRMAMHRLEFEVTEGATLASHQRQAVLEGLMRLQAAGARIVMDDFGTGYSSLGTLRDYRFDKLKIDRSFVGAMQDHRPSASIVRATIGLGKSLGVTIVAEGVETEQQLNQLRLWGCHQVQGYLVGRPEEDSTALAGFRAARAEDGDPKPRARRA